MKRLIMLDSLIYVIVWYGKIWWVWFGMVFSVVW